MATKTPPTPKAPNIMTAVLKPSRTDAPAPRRAVSEKSTSPTALAASKKISLPRCAATKYPISEASARPARNASPTLVCKVIRKALAAYPSPVHKSGKSSLRGRAGFKRPNMIAWVTSAIPINPIAYAHSAVTSVSAAVTASSTTNRVVRIRGATSASANLRRSPWPKNKPCAKLHQTTPATATTMATAALLFKRDAWGQIIKKTAQAQSSVDAIHAHKSKPRVRDKSTASLPTCTARFCLSPQSPSWTTTNSVAVISPYAPKPSGERDLARRRNEITWIPRVAPRERKMAAAWPAKFFTRAGHAGC